MKDNVVLSTPTRSVRLKTILDVRRLLAKTINGLLRDELDASKAARVGYLCGIMLKAFEMGEFEHRIEQLEKIAADERRTSSAERVSTLT